MIKIVGNGLSRLDFNVKEDFEKDVPIIACNAYYRDLKSYDDIDFLVAIDTGMISEIRASGFPLEKLYVPPYEDQFEPAEYNVMRPRENAGMVAMRLAISKGYKILVCFGMDFMIHDHQYNIGNIYDGTKNYTLDTRASVDDTFARYKYMMWFARKNPDVNFYFVFSKNDVPKLRDLMNIENIFYALPE